MQAHNGNQGAQHSVVQVSLGTSLHGFTFIAYVLITRNSAKLAGSQKNSQNAKLPADGAPLENAPDICLKQVQET